MASPRDENIGAGGRSGDGGEDGEGCLSLNLVRVKVVPGRSILDCEVGNGILKGRVRYGKVS